ncbi:MAG TPA: cyclic nucleotide-binding domain-containing protein [candidate division Zixibacteria bacterium]|nr:cyclic nucleotide-binding domain-containing protein [candidate division Zixibacteria bacterium]
MAQGKFAQAESTMAMRLEQFKDRWTSIGTNSGITQIKEKPTPSQLRQYELFKEFDDAFLEKISPDISIARWQKESTLFEEGTYVDLAFYVIGGNVKVYSSTQSDEKILDAPIFDSGRTGALILEKTEKPKGEGLPQGTVLLNMVEDQIKKVKQKSGEIKFLATMGVNVALGNEATLGGGDVFGEIGALIGWPQAVTAKTTSDCEIIQIRVPALRQMKRKSENLKSKIDKIYKDRLLLAQLRGTPLFQNCDRAFLQSLKERMELVSFESGEKITLEGEPTDWLYMVRSGFVRLAQKFGSGQIVATYLSKGMTLGEVEILIGNTGGWIFTATSVEHTELVKIPRQDFEQLVKRFPAAEKLMWASAVARIKESGYSRRNIQHSEFISTALEQGLVEGSSILVIDLDECTRCDDCVRACADTHDGIPRFVREGNKFNNLLMTRACYHCQDPVCLIGCPTGAIRRARVGSVVEILPDLCIGCKTCANNCPYDAITMFETGETWPNNMIPEGLRGKPRLLATKCNLCYDTGHGPACVSNCPHGCAYRVGSVEQFQSLVSKKKEA